MKIEILKTLSELTYKQIDEIEAQGTIIESTHYNTIIYGTKYNIETLCMYFNEQGITWTEI